MSFSNKVVLITGASSGIGAAIAVAFAKERANVVMVGRNEAKLKNVADECEKAGTKPLVIKADVAYEDQVVAMMKETIQKYGRLDVLVNNAGITGLGSLMDGKILHVYDDIMKVNMRAQVHVTSEAVKYLIESKGNIVNISSAAAFTPAKNASYTSYYISKAAFNQFTKCAALELSKFNVRVNAICPGMVQSDLLDNAGIDLKFDSFANAMPLKKIAQPEEVADLVLFLASDKAKSVTGAAYVMDNGVLLQS